METARRRATHDRRSRAPWFARQQALGHFLVGQPGFIDRTPLDQARGRDGDDDRGRAAIARSQAKNRKGRPKAAFRACIQPLRCGAALCGLAITEEGHSREADEHHGPR